MYRERLFHKRCNVSYPLSCYRRSTEPQGEHGDSTVVLSVLERGNPKPFKEMTKPCVVKLDETPTNLYAISQRLLVSCLSIECLALGDQGQGRRGGDFPEKRHRNSWNEESCRFWKPFDMSTMHLPPCPLVVPKPTGARQR
jgi:hypothetical protein